MSVLNKKGLEDRLKMPITNPKNIVITPLMRPTEAFDNDSVDLRLGTYFLMPQIPQGPS